MTDEIMRFIVRLFAQHARRMRNIVARGVVSLVQDGLKMQGLQVELLNGEIIDGAEHPQPYGFSSHAHSGAEAFVAFCGADRAHPLVLCVDDRRFRIKGAKAGEVVLYTDEGDTVWFKRGRTIAVAGGEKVSVATKKLVAEASGSAEIVSPEVMAICDTFDVAASEAVNVDTPQLTVTGNLVVGGHAAVTGMVGAAGYGIGAPGVAEAGKVKANVVEDAAGTLAGVRDAHNAHTHTAPSGGGATSGPSVTA